MSIQGYNNPKIGSSTNNQKAFLPRTYKGFSTVGSNSIKGSLYDLALIKQDLINQFYIRKGEKLENPEFGTIIWDMLFEPLTEQVKSLIVNDITVIVNSDPRIKSIKTIVTQVDKGLQVEVTLMYLPYNIQETMQLTFDKDNGLI
jgi:hypothetical protein